MSRSKSRAIQTGTCTARSCNDMSSNMTHVIHTQPWQRWRHGQQPSRQRKQLKPRLPPWLQLLTSTCAFASGKHGTVPVMLTIVECSSLPDRHPWAWHESLQNLELACLVHSFALRKHGLTTRPSFASLSCKWHEPTAGSTSRKTMPLGQAQPAWSRSTACKRDTRHGSNSARTPVCWTRPQAAQSAQIFQALLRALRFGSCSSNMDGRQVAFTGRLLQKQPAMARAKITKKQAAEIIQLVPDAAAAKPGHTAPIICKLLKPEACPEGRRSTLIINLTTSGHCMWPWIHED